MDAQTDRDAYSSASGMRIRLWLFSLIGLLVLAASLLLLWTEPLSIAALWIAVWLSSILLAFCVSLIWRRIFAPKRVEPESGDSTGAMLGSGTGGLAGYWLAVIIRDSWPASAAFLGVAAYWCLYEVLLESTSLRRLSGQAPSKAA